MERPMSGLQLRILEPTDVTQACVNWFCDKQVTEFSNNQFHKFNIEGQIKYVKRILAF